MSARLERAWLVDADLRCEHRERLDDPLSVELELGDLAFDDVGDGHIAVRVGFDLELAGKNGASVSILAVLRLLYVMRPPADLAERRRFACEQALPDAWPVWRTWLNGTLAAMGLPPDPLPAGLPAKLMAGGTEAFDLTLQIDNSLARPAGERSRSARR